MSARPRASREKTRPSIFWVLAGIVVPVVGLLARIEIVGGEKLPRKGAYVLAPNHYSEIDPLIVAVAVWRLGRAPRFMAKESLFRVPVLGWALRATGMVPVARASTSSGAAQTIEASRRLVDEGRGVIVYPEGTLTRDPDMWPMRGKTGAARLALAAGRAAMARCAAARRASEARRSATCSARTTRYREASCRGAFCDRFAKA